MEIIKLAGYFIDEKVQIAKRHLIPTLSQQTGLSRVFMYPLQTNFVATNR